MTKGKTIEELAQQIKFLKERVGEVEGKIKQFECKHDGETELVEKIMGSFNYRVVVWRKVCSLCGKILKTYPQQCDFLKAQKEVLDNRIKVECKKEKKN